MKQIINKKSNRGQNDRSVVRGSACHNSRPVNISILKFWLCVQITKIIKLMKFQTIRAKNKYFMGCQTLKSGQNDRSDVLVLIQEISYASQVSA